MKRVIICGKACSGKDYLKAKLITDGLVPSVSYTTREPRVGETEGSSYYFIKEAEFLSMIDCDKFREWNKFANKWYYGTTQEAFDLANIFIMTPSGLKALSEAERKESLIIYIDVPEEIRRERLCARKDKDDPERRLATDRADFEFYADYDWHITDAYFDLKSLSDKIKKNLEPHGMVSENIQ